MVRLGPDMDLYTAESGYLEGKDIIGFSHIHCSGTGGVPSYGNILTMATIGKPELNNYSSPWSNEKARPGYYSVHLTRHNIDAELTVTKHTGFHQYTFPESDSATVLFDAGSFTGLDDTYSESQILTGSEVHILSDSEIEGYNRIRGGWTGLSAFSVYFYARFDTPCQSYGTWKNGKIYLTSREQYDSGEKTGAYLTFRTHEGQKIKVKVGISYISCLKAKANMENEIKDWNFDRVVAQADDEWNKILNKIIIDNGSEDDLKVFYTALFHANIMPTDKMDQP
jgi:putative alpha-1,2-mannosidase